MNNDDVRTDMLVRFTPNSRALIRSGAWVVGNPPYERLEALATGVYKVLEQYVDDEHPATEDWVLDIPVEFPVIDRIFWSKYFEPLTPLELLAMEAE